mgnify:CR=1 FL=1
MGYLMIEALSKRLRHAVIHTKDTLHSDTLRGKIFRNVGWMGVGYSAELVLRFISTLILTRILDPSAYGLITTVMVFLTFAAMLSDLGLRPIMLTDSRGDDKNFLGILWTIQILRGFALAVIMAVTALIWQYWQAKGWINSTNNYADPLLPQLLLLMGFSLAVTGFNSLNEFRAIRHLEADRISRLDIASRILGTMITIVLVVIFRSVWGMAIAIMANAALRVVLTHRYLPGPSMAFDINWPEIRKVLSTSRWIALNSALVVIAAQADKVLIGYHFGVEILGIYAIALTLFTSASALVNRVNMSMGIPVLRELGDRSVEDQRRAYYKFRLPIDLYCLTVGCGMVLLGPIFFKIAYDSRYETGGLFLAYLGIKIILMPLLLYGNFLMTKLRFKMTSLISLFRSAIFLSAMGVAMWFNSIEAMVLCIALDRLPEILLYIFYRRAGVRLDGRRDGILLLAATVATFYIILMY